MSKTYKDSPDRKGTRKNRERSISVRAVRRDPPDLRKLSRALIQLAMAQAEADARSAAAATTDTTMTQSDKATDD